LADSHFIGIDIGATLIKMGVVTREGALVSRDEARTDEINGPSHFVKIAGETFERLLVEAGVEKRAIGAVGIGAPGWVDHQRGIVHELTNIPDWRDFPLARKIEETLGLSVFVDNDANVMAVGEMLYGAGRGYKNFICLTLGTGVGGAIIIDGAIHRGANGLAGEVGHMSIDTQGRQCACGALGCLENYVGNRSIVARALELMGESPTGGSGSIIYEMAGGDPANITTKTIADAAAKGDAVALEVWRETGRRLGSAMAGLINLLDPECFVVGGGVAKAGPVLFDRMKEAMASLAMNKLGRSTPILEAELGEHAGLIGAATFAMLSSERD
jgi:glucokinase